MKCYLCGKPVKTIFGICHKECADKLHGEFLEVDTVIEKYKSGQISCQIAKEMLVKATSTDNIQAFFWKNIYSKCAIRTYDKVVYSQDFIEVAERKNSCKMERTGLSYARMPNWEVNTYTIAQNASAVLTDSGVYILEAQDLYIPYSRIVDVGVDGRRVYFDVNTTSPYGHRYYLWQYKSKDMDFRDNVCDVLRIMANIRM